MEKGGPVRVELKAVQILSPCGSDLLLYIMVDVFLVSILTSKVKRKLHFVSVNED